MQESFSPTNTVTVASFQKWVWEFVKAKGWNEKPVTVPEMVALIHSEASEALESFRKNEPVSWTHGDSSDTAGKPEGIASEFADIVIRVAHYSTLLGIDLESEIVRKMRYNFTREHRHGGKAI